MFLPICDYDLFGYRVHGTNLKTHDLKNVKHLIVCLLEKKKIKKKERVYLNQF